MIQFTWTPDPINHHSLVIKVNVLLIGLVELWEYRMKQMKGSRLVVALMQHNLSGCCPINYFFLADETRQQLPG